MIKKTLVVVTACLMLTNLAWSQGNEKPNYLGQTNTITTAVPFLLIASDARSGAMGDVGAATTPDAASMHWNPAKYAFIESKAGFSASYSPWLRALVSDINLAYVSGFYRIDDKQTVAASLLYFTLGDIQFTNIEGGLIGNYRPNEFSVDATYSRKFSETWSGAVAARYIHSNLTQGVSVSGQATKPGQSVAADIAVYHQRELDWSNFEYAEFALGINISNIGSKISYSDATTQKDFIPTNLRIGPRLTLDLDDYNRLSFMLDVNKLLVPTPPDYFPDSTNAEGFPVIRGGMNPDVGPIEGVFQSWYDAPGGFEEELREFYFATGVEYWYNKVFAVRGGFFYENKNKGNRKYFTLGAGLKYNVFGLDFSYLIPLEQQNPLENTLRFTLSFDFADF
ncbi:MAG TPA: type IX secretion system outer membrane channel protein PorV [Bacteroidales bacterium]|nr:type IX secretion system outer membrane channel protein PorV [Bacteroidales bacterium]